MSLSVTFEEGQRVTVLTGSWQYDYGQTLTISGLSGLPAEVPVHFAPENATTSETRVGQFINGILTVTVPDSMFKQSCAFWAYVYITDGTSGQTVRGIKCMPYARPEPSGDVTPDQKSAFDQLVSELNNLIATVSQVNSTAAASADAAKVSETNAKQSETVSAQSLSDLLAMLGKDVATLINGKLNPAQIPDLSINDVFSVANTDAMLTLNAQRGDCALIVVDDTVSDSYLLAADDPAVLVNWKKLGVSYVANAGHAMTADEAANAATINNHRVVTMTQDQYDSAVKDPDTIYLVG